MKNGFIEDLKFAVKNWWLSLILGILFVAVALILMFFPLQSYGVLAILFSITMFVSGIFEITFSVSNKKALPGWGWYLALGVLDLILGVFLLIYPGLSMAVIPFIFGFWLMFRGFSIIGYSIDLQRFGSKNWGWYLALGILTIICAVGVIFYPVAGAFSVVYIIAFIFLFLGIARVMLAFDLRNLYNDYKKTKKRLEE